MLNLEDSLMNRKVENSISERSFDTEDWSNDAENSALPSQM